MIRTHIEFKSNKFPPYEDEENEINPGRWGKRLAEYLSLKLKESGVSIGNIYAEDWGWAIPIKGKPCDMWIGCGNYDEYPNGFLCFIEPSKPSIRKFLKKIDISEDLKFLSGAIDKILNAESEITDIKWWMDNEK